MKKIKNNRLYKQDIAILKDYGGIKRKITLVKSYRVKGIEALESENNYRGEKGKVNDKKQTCNVLRAKTRVFEYAYCNEFEYFVTLTINPNKYDRTDLKKYYKDFSQWLRNYKKNHNLKIEYIFIPELHSDKKAWHMHGFLKGIPIEHFTENENGYLDWEPYKKKFGYISIDKIRNRAKAASYITKYISKNLSDCIQDINAKMYYNSKGLKTAEEIKIGSLKSEFSKPDFESEWVKIKWFQPSVSIESLKDMIY